MEKKMVFVCSPFGGEEKNLQKAREYCKYVTDQDKVPYAPHLFFPQFLNDHNAYERGLGMSAGMRVMLECDEVWVFCENGITRGMVQEIEHAARNGLPVRYLGNKYETGFEKPASKQMEFDYVQYL